MKNKTKGQEEIVGFVAIVLIVAVIALVFLGITLRGEDNTVRDNNDIRRFIESSLMYTSDCALGYEPNYASLKDLIKGCYSEPAKACLDGRSVCLALNQSLGGILNVSWQTGEDSRIKGYTFKAVYSRNTSSENVTGIVRVNSGNCSGESYTEGSSFFSVYPGTITCYLRICNAE